MNAVKHHGVLGSAVMTWIYAISISDTLGEGAFIMSLSMLFVPIVAWQRDEVAGLVRLGLSQSFGTLHIIPAIQELLFEVTAGRLGSQPLH